MKVVTLPHSSRIAGRTWIPDELQWVNQLLHSRPATETIQNEEKEIKKERKKRKEKENSPIANKTDVLALERNIGVPVGRVEEGSLVLLNARDGRPLPVVQDAAGVDENVGEVADRVARDVVADLDVVAVLLVVPEGADDLVLGLDVALEAVLVCEGVEVIKDLCRWWIDGGPVELGLEGPCVVVGGNIASATINAVSEMHW